MDEGINLTFDTQYTLSLKHEDRYLYYGGHAEGSALVDYDAFDLDGTETLRGGLPSMMKLENLYAIMHGLKSNLPTIRHHLKLTTHSNLSAQKVE